MSAPTLCWSTKQTCIEYDTILSGKALLDICFIYVPREKKAPFVLHVEV